jgi:hypothetical protein
MPHVVVKLLAGRPEEQKSLLAAQLVKDLRADCTGMLVYTRDGHVSVQVMYREPQTGSPSRPVQYAQGG